ncbi:MAG: serine hydroxymethyltransferase [Tissierellia bacterium]|nr:serine hydroxymethyltransferase [Tissierellia bacterium]
MLTETRKTDPELARLVEEEYQRQEDNIEMIASESTAPIAVMELAGSVFTNKTLEGYPGGRYQAGSQVADKVELLGIERAKELFKADHVNIQPYSGSTANYSVYAAILEKGDRILSMRLDQGGHLTHGSPANWMSKFYTFEFYSVDKETEQIDYEGLRAKAKEYKPRLIIAGASSYPRLIDYEAISEIAKEVDAYFMVDMAHIAGLVAAEIIPSPMPYADFVSSSTTKTFCSARSGMIFCKEQYAKILDKGAFPGCLGSIHLATMAAKAWSFKYAASKEFKTLMQQVVNNAKTLGAELEKHGFRLVSGGTDTHLLLVDLRGKQITGSKFQQALDSISLTVNKNMIPFDTEKPWITSGVRIGTTAVSQRGMKEEEMVKIGQLMNDVARDYEDVEKMKTHKTTAEGIIAQFPLYPAEYKL